MEGVVVDRRFWSGKRVFVTGQTGFKGSWLAFWLTHLGADVTGYSLAPPTEPNLFEIAGIDGLIDHEEADVRDAERLKKSLARARPEIVFHLAAQSLVLPSYSEPRETFETNVMGTVNLFEAVRACDGIEAVVNVTSDKCYENRAWVWGYRENEALGGHDPYSASKACAELVTGSFIRSFFSDGPPIASARAGNVIGGGDWSADRLIPDLIRGFLSGSPVPIRNPAAIRPWQHVLDALAGYLRLAERLAGPDGSRYSGAWNFGPDGAGERTVGEIAARCRSLWGGGAAFETGTARPGPHEAAFLKLDSSKARGLLGWSPRWPLDDALIRTVEWYRAYAEGGTSCADLVARQIDGHQDGAYAGPAEMLAGTA